MSKKIVILFLLPILNLFSSEYELSLCAVLEGSENLVEWIQINKSYNVNHFYLVDFSRVSKDESIRDILNYYAKDVTVIDYELNQTLHPTQVRYFLWLALRIHHYLYSSKLFVFTHVLPDPYTADPDAVSMVGYSKD